MTNNLEAENANWLNANYGYLNLAVEQMRQNLECRAAELHNQPPPQIRDYEAELEATRAAMSKPPALEQLCSIFNLSAFERDVLILCLGTEWYANWGDFCASAGMLNGNFPTWSLAFRGEPQLIWGATTPKGTLHRWNLIEVEPSPALHYAPLRINEWTLHYLMGYPCLDEELIGVVNPVEGAEVSVPSHQHLARQAAALWEEDAPNQQIIQLCGVDRASNYAIASSICTQLGLQLHALSSYLLLLNPSNIKHTLKLWERQAKTSKLALLIDADELAEGEMGKPSSLPLILRQLSCPTIVTGRDRAVSENRSCATFDIPKPSPGEQLVVWQETLGEKATQLNGFVETLVSQFDLGASTIQTATTLALGSLDDSEPNTDTLQTQLWNTCRAQARPQLDELAQPIEPVASWDDLILPEEQLQTLRSIVAHVRRKGEVYHNWEFRGKSERGLGIAALFAGVSGTGKTMAAEVIAKELNLDLYRIDLSAVVSKYIGETEKNLRRIFDAADKGGVVLLFDEADALFGKRSTVKDSRDRYANMEVSYLLQRMEAYRGLAILTTNFKGALDAAFLRRIRFIVKFPFPFAPERQRIWERVFPEAMPRENLSYGKLAQLNMAGGNIRNIALNAAFLAAEEEEAVTMERLLRATKSEYVKLERPLTDVEIRGWV
ncbi:MAG: ATP-binding protein [Cyanobacteriota bacterium]|nr:ATP-binding protein [Cyanobacteriota bacterium]